MTSPRITTRTASTTLARSRKTARRTSERSTTTICSSITARATRQTPFSPRAHPHVRGRILTPRASVASRERAGGRRRSSRCAPYGRAYRGYGRRRAFAAAKARKEIEAMRLMPVRATLLKQKLIHTDLAPAANPPNSGQVGIPSGRRRSRLSSRRPRQQALQEPRLTDQRRLHLTEPRSPRLRNPDQLPPARALPSAPFTRGVNFGRRSGVTFRRRLTVRHDARSAPPSSPVWGAAAKYLPGILGRSSPLTTYRFRPVAN